MNHSPADVVRWLLVTLGVGTDPYNAMIRSREPATIASQDAMPTWPVHAAGEPDSPAEVITVYDTTYQSDGRSQHTGEPYFHYGVQVRVRGRDHPSTFQKAYDILLALTEDTRNAVVTPPATVNPAGVSYLVEAVSKASLIPLGKFVPVSKLNLVTINAMVALRQLASGAATLSESPSRRGRRPSLEPEVSHA